MWSGVERAAACLGRRAVLETAILQRNIGAVLEEHPSAGLRLVARALYRKVFYYDTAQRVGVVLLASALDVECGVAVGLYPLAVSVDGEISGFYRDRGPRHRIGIFLQPLHASLCNLKILRENDLRPGSRAVGVCRRHGVEQLLIAFYVNGARLSAARARKCKRHRAESRERVYCFSHVLSLLDFTTIYGESSPAFPSSPFTVPRAKVVSPVCRRYLFCFADSDIFT